jgi:hypothetical protein
MEKTIMTAYDEKLATLRHYSKVGTGDKRVAAVEAAMELHKLKKSSVTDIAGEPGGEITILGHNYTVKISVGDESSSRITWEKE